MLTGYKFESIRVLHNERIVAWEVLSTAADQINLEHFFSNLALDARVELFFAQLAHVINTAGSGKYYLNASADVMLTPHFLQQLEEQVVAPERIAVELTDLDQLMALTPSKSQQLRACINAVRGMGLPSGLTTFMTTFCPAWLNRIITFPGPKLINIRSGRHANAKNHFLSWPVVAKRLPMKSLWKASKRSLTIN